MGTALVAETATVWRVGGRRYLSKRAAIHRIAVSALQRKYPCECEPDVGHDCGCAQRLGTIGVRYERMLKRKYNARQRSVRREVQP